MTATDPLIPQQDWHEAFTLCSGLDRDEVDSVIEDHPDLTSVVTALVAAYDGKADGDNDIVRACLIAAGERHGPSWSVTEFHAVVQSFAVCLSGGWAELAQDYLDEHYPGFPPGWRIELTTIGKDVRRDGEQYVTLDGSDALYVFNRPT